jgi:signal transduction histidine kinase
MAQQRFPTFTVDTHLFRELGELLVGRDSTALVELIKNSYDADATLVTVTGTNLSNPKRGSITIHDDGCGMTADVFEDGFLRVASRIKEVGNRRSAFYKRRYTGAKGVGRLAAQKLAMLVKIISQPDDGESNCVVAEIDWKKIDALETLEKIEGSKAIKVLEHPYGHRGEDGTTLELITLARKWGAVERARFMSEVHAFTPPAELYNLPKNVTDESLLFSTPTMYDSGADDPGFKVELKGDFAAGDDYWKAVANASNWILEIDAGVTDPNKNKYRVIPTEKTKSLLKGKANPKAEPFSERRKTTAQTKFQARILIRQGHTAIKDVSKTWLNSTAGVRVYVEGFRVLPYGESGNDWLSLDADYVNRSGKQSNLVGTAFSETTDELEGFSVVPNKNYFGAVFVQIEKNPKLDMVVTREGFIPNPAYDELVQIVRTGIGLSTRVRAKYSAADRQDRRDKRAGKTEVVDTGETTRKELKQTVVDAVESANQIAKDARTLAAQGKIDEAARLITKAGNVFRKGGEASSQLISEPTILNILASVGTQMSEFVHEILSMLGMANAIEESLALILEEYELDSKAERRLKMLLVNICELRRSVERQASYLTDVVSADARRRRSRQDLAKRFERAKATFSAQCEKRGIDVENKIPSGLKSPPMFPAEINVVFSNLLSNAIKACKKGGKIRASATTMPNKKVRLRIDNTGRKVNVEKSEKWFRPFESTTTQVNSVLGQGMGMGLTITRKMLQEYGATIRFVAPRAGFNSAIEILFP